MVQGGLSFGMKHPSAQEGEASTAVHCALKHFEAANLIFDGACGPRQVERCLNSADVLAQFCDKRSQHGVGRRIQNVGEHLIALAPK